MQVSPIRWVKGELVKKLAIMLVSFWSGKGLGMALGLSLGTLLSKDSLLLPSALPVFLAEVFPVIEDVFTPEAIFGLA